jgi:hypothetical protein
MSYMNAVALPWEWVLLGGGIGGAVNALLSNNLSLLPALTLDRHGPTGTRVVRVGSLASSTVGAAAAAGVFWALRGLVDLDVALSSQVVLPLLVSSFFVGFVSARGLTSEADKALLRLAVRNAATSPAAHPQIAEAIEHAPPYAVYKLALDLVPRRRSRHTSQLHLPRGLEKAEPQRL